MPTPDTTPSKAQDTVEQDRRNWANLVKAQMDAHHIPSAAELARKLDRPSVKRSDTARWLRAEVGPAPESALRFAEYFGLPAMAVLRTAGLREIADHFERLVGEVSPALRETLTARARKITEGAPEPEARAIIDSVLSGAEDLLLAAEAKADRARTAEHPQRRRNAS